MECTLECREMNLEHRNPVLVKIVNWLGKIRIEGAEQLSKTK